MYMLCVTDSLIKFPFHKGTKDTHIFTEQLHTYPKDFAFQVDDQIRQFI